MIDYPINRLLLHIGLLCQTFLVYLPEVEPHEKGFMEALLADALDLDRYVEEGLLQGYRFQWYYLRRGGGRGREAYYRFRSIHLVPHPRVRRTPGIKILKRLFFDFHTNYEERRRAMGYYRSSNPSPTPTSRRVIETPPSLRNTSFSMSHLPDIPSPGGKRKRGKGKPLVLTVDFTQPPAEQILPCSENRQGAHLGWNIKEVRAVNETLDPYNTLPMICQAEACYWASRCPTRPEFLFEGLSCPLEIVDIYRNFVRYVQELDVNPDDHVDLKLILDLLRIDLQTRRVDQQIQLQGMEAEKVTRSANSTTTEKVIHHLLTYQRGLRQDRSDLYKQLVASREAKKKAEAVDTRGKTDLLQLMARMKDAAEKKKIAVVEEPLPALPASAEETLFDEEENLS